MSLDTTNEGVVAARVRALGDLAACLEQAERVLARCDAAAAKCWAAGCEPRQVEDLVAEADLTTAAQALLSST